MAGFRLYTSGAINPIEEGYYSISTVNGVFSRIIYFRIPDMGVEDDRRAYGNSVRCIKD
jgi:hypothetical protein